MMQQKPKSSVRPNGVLPVSKHFDGENFWTVQNGVKIATPLLLVVALVGFTDVIFAVDSIPAIYAITSDPFIVLTSNIFAILGLRALYFLLAGAMDKFHLLHFGLGVVLMFVGAKMLLPIWGVHVPIGISLAVICGVIGASVGLSLLLPRHSATMAASGGNSDSDS